MRLKKTVTIVLVAVLVVSGLVVAFVNAGDVADVGVESEEPVFGVGSGTPENPYMIYDVYDLQNMSANLTAHYALANNINASETSGWNGGEGFEPVGPGPYDKPANHFTGSLDGQNYTITGLYIDRTSMDYVGLFGYVGDGGEVRNVGVVDADVSGDSRVGGLMGHNSFGVVSNSYANGNVSGNDFVGGLVGYLNHGTVSNSFYNIDSVLINDGHHITIGGIFDAQYQDWYSSDLHLDIADYNDTLVPSGDYYEISNVQGIRDLLGFAWNDSYRFHLSADINLSSVPELYIPYLDAEFDGNNNTFSSLFIDIPFAAHIGLFGYVGSSGKVRNVGVVDADVSGNDYVGGLVGENGGTVSNSYATGNVSGYSRVGGLVGRNDGTVSNLYATGNVSGYSRVGGLVGYNWHGTVEDSYATGTVSGTEEVGGLVGYNWYGTVEDSYATGTVSGGDSTGGLVGYLNHGTVSNSFYDIETTGQSDTGKGEPKTTTEMKTQSTFTDAGWDFADTWHMIENVTYPLFQWQDLPEAASMQVDLFAYDGSDGWNFVSFNIDLVDTSLESILADIDGSYDRLMYYDASANQWSSYVPGRAYHFNNLQSWDKTMGIWIKVSTNPTLNLTGYAPTSTDITLYPGWNMVGLPSTTAGNHGLPEEIAKIGYFNASAKYNVEYDYEPATFVFEPGQGYWIYNSVDEAVIWTVNY